MNHAVHAHANPLNDADMKKILDIVKNNVTIYDFQGSEIEKEYATQAIAVFRFVKQLLVEMPALTHSVVNGVIQSSPIVSKYLVSCGFVTEENASSNSNMLPKDLHVLLTYIVNQTEIFHIETTVPKGSTIN